MTNTTTPATPDGLIEELRSEHEELLRSQSFDYGFGDDEAELDAPQGTTDAP